MTAVATYHPVGVEDLAGLIAEAAARGDKLEIRGGGSKAGLGAPRDAAVVDMTGFSGVIDYDPAELVLTVLAGTPLAEVQALVESRGQMLAFDPFDHGPLFGAAPGAATIGGVMAAGVSGSRRLSRGAARDHLLGFKAVSGRGEVFVGGAKVVKNVTGYDLPKVACGSWGRLFALAEVTVKVLPRPPVSLTLAVEGLLPRGAVAVMSRALGSQADVAAAAHTGEGRRLTALRLDGFGPSVPARRAALEHLLADAGPVRALDEVEAQDFWGSLCTLQPLAHGPVLWRVALPARRAPELIEALEPLGARWMMDWGGALIWLAWGGEPRIVRAAAEAAGGHAQLLRAPEALRRAVPALHPQASGVKALEARLRRAFDPKGVFETGRFLDGMRSQEGADAD